MNMQTAGIQISPVNMEDRKNLGIKPGDTVNVHQKIQEKGKTRIQQFSGLVLAQKHGTEPGATFTVRKVVDGIGVEKIFPLYSPLIDKIEITRRSKVRRAKLYYIREKVAREIKRQMRRMKLVNIASESEQEVAQRAEQEAKEAEAKAAEEAAKKAEEEKQAAALKEAEAQAKESESETPQEETPVSEDAKKDEGSVTDVPQEEKEVTIEKEGSKEAEKK